MGDDGSNELYCFTASSRHPRCPADVPVTCRYGSLICAYLSGSSSFASFAAAQIKLELSLEPHSLISNKDAGSACFRGFVWEAGRAFAHAALSPIVAELLLDEAMPSSVFEINPASLPPPPHASSVTGAVAEIETFIRKMIKSLNNHSAAAPPALRDLVAAIFAVSAPNGSPSDQKRRTARFFLRRFILCTLLRPDVALPANGSNRALPPAAQVALQYCAIVVDKAAAHETFHSDFGYLTVLNPIVRECSAAMMQFIDAIVSSAAAAAAAADVVALPLVRKDVAILSQIDWMCRDSRSCVEQVARAEMSTSVQRAFVEIYSTSKDIVWAACKMYIQSPVPPPSPSTLSSVAQASSRNDRDWFQHVGGSSDDSRLLLTVRHKPDGKTDVYVTSLTAGLVSCFSLSPPSAASDSNLKPVLLVDDDQGFFVLNHNHPLSPKQGYVILDADLRAVVLRSCGYTSADEGAGANGPRMLHCVSYMCQRREDSARRGTHARAIAIVSAHRWSLALRPLVVEATVSTFSPETSKPVDILPRLMDAANSIPCVPSFSDVERCVRRWGPCGGRFSVTIPPGQALSSSKLEVDSANVNVMSCSVVWDGRPVALTVPVLLDEHELCAANVSLLLKTFKENTATIFRFCLLEKRVLFLGRSASAWTTCKMVIIAASMVGAARRHVLHSTFPYASLVDTSFLTVAGYIAGVANPVFESHNEWWDILCDVDTGAIKLPTPKQGSRSAEVSPEQLAELQVDCESRLLAQAHNSVVKGDAPDYILGLFQSVCHDVAVSASIDRPVVCMSSPTYAEDDRFVVPPTSSRSTPMLIGSSIIMIIFTIIVTFATGSCLCFGRVGRLLLLHA